MSISNLDSTGFNLILDEVKKELTQSRAEIDARLDNRYSALARNIVGTPEQQKSARERLNLEKQTTKYNEKALDTKHRIRAHFPEDNYKDVLERIKKEENIAKQLQKDKLEKQKQDLNAELKKENERKASIEKEQQIQKQDAQKNIDNQKEEKRIQERAEINLNKDSNFRKSAGVQKVNREKGEAEKQSDQDKSARIMSGNEYRSFQAKEGALKSQKERAERSLSKEFNKESRER